MKQIYCIALTVFMLLQMTLMDGQVTVSNYNDYPDIGIGLILKEIEDRDEEILADIKFMEDEIEKIKSENSTLRKENTTAKQEIFDLEQEVGRLRNELNTTRELLISLKEVLKEVQIELSKTKDENRKREIIMEADVKSYLLTLRRHTRFEVVSITPLGVEGKTKKKKYSSLVVEFKVIPDWNVLNRLLSHNELYEKTDFNDLIIKVQVESSTLAIPRKSRGVQESTYELSPNGIDFYDLEKEFEFRPLRETELDGNVGLKIKSNLAFDFNVYKEYEVEVKLSLRTGDGTLVVALKNFEFAISFDKKSNKFIYKKKNK